MLLNLLCILCIHTSYLTDVTEAFSICQCLSFYQKKKKKMQIEERKEKQMQANEQQQKKNTVQDSITIYAHYFIFRLCFWAFLTGCKLPNRQGKRTLSWMSHMIQPEQQPARTTKIYSTAFPFSILCYLLKP